MFKRPEELIIFVLALLWVALTYFLNTYIGTDTYTALVITGLTLLWAVVCFLLWQRNLSSSIWPLFAGALTACWWPFLDWFAVKDLIVPGAESQAILIAKPWYAGWTFKLILAALPILAGYFLKWKNIRKNKIQPGSGIR